VRVRVRVRVRNEYQWADQRRRGCARNGCLAMSCSDSERRKAKERSVCISMTESLIVCASAGHASLTMQIARPPLFGLRLSMIPSLQLSSSPALTPGPAFDSTSTRSLMLGVCLWYQWYLLSVGRGPRRNCTAIQSEQSELSVFAFQARRPVLDLVTHLIHLVTTACYLNTRLALPIQQHTTVQTVQTVHTYTPLLPTTTTSSTHSLAHSSWSLSSALVFARRSPSGAQ
jgi:hypothetical protein